jgi:hypothetical protein
LFVGLLFMHIAHHHLMASCHSKQGCFINERHTAPIADQIPTPSLPTEVGLDAEQMWWWGIT